MPSAPTRTGPAAFETEGCDDLLPVSVLDSERPGARFKPAEAWRRRSECDGALTAADAEPASPLHGDAEQLAAAVTDRVIVRLVEDVRAAIEPLFQSQSQCLLDAISQLRQPPAQSRPRSPVAVHHSTSLPTHPSPERGEGNRDLTRIVEPFNATRTIKQRKTMSPNALRHVKLADDADMAFSCGPVPTAAPQAAEASSSILPHRSELLRTKSAPEQAVKTNLFVVQINGAEATDLGVRLESQGDELLVKQVHDNGLIMKWNEKSPSKQVSVGDRIVSVNGGRARADILLGAINAFFVQGMPGTLELTVSQGWTNPCMLNVVAPDTDGSSDDPDALKSPPDIPDDMSCHTSLTPQKTISLSSFDNQSVCSKRMSGSKDNLHVGRRVSVALTPQFARCRSGALSECPSDVSGASGGSRSLARRPSQALSDWSNNSPRSATSDHGRRLYRTRSSTSSIQSALTILRCEREAELLESIRRNSADMSIGPVSNHHVALSEICELPAGNAERHVQFPVWLSICGIVPWEHPRLCLKSFRYRCLVHAFMVLVALASAEQFVHAQRSSCGGSSCLQFRELSDLVLAIGSLAGFVALRALRSSNLLGTGTAILVTYMAQRNIVAKWSRHAWTRCVVLIVIWVSTSVFRGCVLWLENRNAGGGLWRPAVSMGTFVVASFAFLGSAYSILHVSCACTQMISVFSTEFATKQDVEKSLQDWNTLQALLRRASRALEKTFLVLTTIALVMLLLGVNSLLLHGTSEIWWFMSIVVLCLSVLMTLFEAAAVTEVCNRLPPLINSYVSADDWDRRMHYLVEYIIYSAAGFYVGEIRLTAAMAVKFTYISCVVAFAVLTRVSSGADVGL